MGKMSAEEKKIQGFPLVLTFEKFEKNLFGRHEAVVESTLASSSRRHRRSRSSVKRKKNEAKSKKLVMVSK
jgi:hypothetical protein